MTDTPITTREDYIRAAGDQALAIEFEDRVLGVGAEFLPEAARVVLRGEKPSAAYWEFLISQLGRPETEKP